MKELALTNDGIVSHFRIKFTIEEPAPIAVVIESLKGFENLIKKTQPLVEKSLNGIKIQRTEVYIDEIIDGSLIYEFIVKHVISEDNIQKAKSLAHDVIGDKPVIKTVVSMGVGAMIYATANNYIGETSSSSETAPALNAYNSVIIQSTNDTNISSEDMQDFIEKSSHDKSVVRNVIDATSPAKLGDGNADLVLEDAPIFNVSHTILNELPENMDHLTPEKREDFYSNLDVYIYASDQDKGHTGWAGIVPDLFEQRVKFAFAEGVDFSALHGRRKIKADVIVHQSFNKNTLSYKVDYVTLKAVE